jgi:L-methionine (R)-S-oxide reductase
MAETTPDVRHLPKRAAYAALEAQARAVLEGVTDPLAAMATFSALLHHGLGHLWTGFYRVADPGRTLRVGPYQGTLGCLEIAFGRGVCGTAAAQGRTVLVPDVQAFAGHISCDARSRSEIVVPVFDRQRSLLAVLDIDSAEPGAFDLEDQRGLEAMMGWFSGAGAPEVSGGMPSAHG